MHRVKLQHTSIFTINGIRFGKFKFEPIPSIPERDPHSVSAIKNAETHNPFHFTVGISSLIAFCTFLFRYVLL